jgi:hypothetical protein
MKPIIQTIIFASVLQILAGAVFTTYMLDRASVLSRDYTDNALRLQYNQLQQQFSNEREGMHDWVDKRINLRLSQLPKEQKQ